MVKHTCEVKPIYTATVGSKGESLWVTSGVPRRREALQGDREGVLAHLSVARHRGTVT